MRTILIGVPGFQERFPKAYEYLKERHFLLLFMDGLEKAAVEYTEVEAVFIASQKCDRSFLGQFPNLKAVARMGSGLDNIDLDICRERNIQVINSKGCNADAVAEMTLGLMLATLRGIVKLNRIMEQEPWKYRYPGEELSGKQIGLVGFGMIAQRLAELLQPFHVKLVAYDPYFSETRGKELRVKKVSMDELLTASDVVSLHIPATKDTAGMFNEAVFSKMKRGAYFINCARGSLVVERDLEKALKSGQLRGAASDVFEHEPVEQKNPLLKLENFIGTPHCAGMTVKSMYADSMAVVQGIAECLNEE